MRATVIILMRVMIQMLMLITKTIPDAGACDRSGAPARDWVARACKGNQPHASPLHGGRAFLFHGGRAPAPWRTRPFFSMADAPFCSMADAPLLLGGRALSSLWRTRLPVPWRTRPCSLADAPFLLHGGRALLLHGQPPCLSQPLCPSQHVPCAL